MIEPFPYKRSLREETLLEQIRRGKLFGYVQCDIEEPEELLQNFDNFPPVLKNTNVGRLDIGLPMKDYAEEEGLLYQPRKLLISSYFHENGESKLKCCRGNIEMAGQQLLWLSNYGS